MSKIEEKSERKSHKLFTTSFLVISEFKPKNTDPNFFSQNSNKLDKPQIFVNYLFINNNKKPFYIENIV